MLGADLMDLPDPGLAQNKQSVFYRDSHVRAMEMDLRVSALVLSARVA